MAIEENKAQMKDKDYRVCVCVWAGVECMAVLKFLILLIRTQYF